MRVGICIVGSVLVGLSGSACAESGGIWAENQSHVWRSDSSGPAGVWKTNSDVWSSGTKKSSSKPKKPAGPVPHALMFMSSPDADHKSQQASSQKTEAAEASKVMETMPAYYDDFGLPHAGSMIVNGKKILVAPNDDHYSDDHNFGAPVFTPPRAASDANPPGGKITGTFIQSPDEKEEDAEANTIREEAK